MKLIAARAGHNVDLTASRASHFTRITSCLSFDFLDSVRRRTEIERIESRICIGGSIEQEVIRIRSIASDTYSGALTGSPVECTHVTSLGTVRFVCARHG